ncbi:butyrate kinase [Desulfoluna butyratoxydans]|uniref:Probable butyrate kinase n=1 Tax=Desulfoluna butyratoxydans TaxID=231438 RepID=A0A4V6ILC3_9BACT|nr:butyrate kinase [Desulfoluna butyratoxydans]VFQ44578.1 butyrate kinase [Desulfoluna butyratoxydans]
MKILAIDPGSTSTKIGVFTHGEMIQEGMDHDRDLIDSFAEIHEQEEMRFACITRALETRGFGTVRFDAVVGRGGLIRPVTGGVYRVCDSLLADLRTGVSGSHASNLGGILARRFAASSGCEALIVDPVVVDELDDVARLSGLEGIERKSIFHALNQKAVARRVAEERGGSYHQAHLIVAHMGGGVTVGAHKKGRVVDVNNGLDGDGPYAAERSGSLPVDGMAEALRKGRFTPDSLVRTVSRSGGIFSYLGIVDLREVERRMDAGDSKAVLIWRGMVYQIAKEIGGLAAAMDGDVDAIVLTGGMAHSRRLTEAISEKTGFIADVVVVPGEFELEALAEGALRVLEGEEKVKRYETGEQ